MGNCFIMSLYLAVRSKWYPENVKKHSEASLECPVSSCSPNEPYAGCRTLNVVQKFSEMSFEMLE